VALHTARDLKSSSNIFDLQSRGLNNHPDIEEAEATYVAERPKGTKAGGPFWLLRHITGIATKRNDPAGILGPNVSGQQPIWRTNSDSSRIISIDNVCIRA